jgi:hypothetical protein
MRIVVIALVQLKSRLQLPDGFVVAKTLLVLRNIVAVDLRHYLSELASPRVDA